MSPLQRLGHLCGPRASPCEAPAGSSAARCSGRSAGSTLRPDGSSTRQLPGGDRRSLPGGSPAAPVSPRTCKYRSLLLPSFLKGGRWVCLSVPPSYEGFFHCSPPLHTSDTSIFISTGAPKPGNNPDTSQLSCFGSELSSLGPTLSSLFAHSISSDLAAFKHLKRHVPPRYLGSWCFRIPPQPPSFAVTLMQGSTLGICSPLHFCCPGVHGHLQTHPAPGRYVGPRVWKLLETGRLCPVCKTSI